MRMPHIAAAAGLFVAALGIGSAAEARPNDGWRDGRHHGWNDNRGRHHGWNNYRGHRGRQYGWNQYGGRPQRWNGRRGYAPRCWTEWRWNQRVRVCR